MTVVEEFCQDISKYYPDKNDFYGWYVAFCVVNGILSIFAIFGNTVIICALTKTTCFLSPSKILLLGLAISDLSVGIVVQPLYITVLVEALSGDAVSPDSQCKSRIAFLVVGSFLAGASFFTVSAISFDRFLAITLHLRYKGIVTEKKVTLTLTVLWVLSACAAIGYLLMANITREAVSTTFSIIFFVTTTMTFVRIYLAVRRHRLQIQTQERPTADKELALSKRKFKTAMNTFYVYIVFTACYLPYTITVIVIATTSHGLAMKGIFHLSMTLGFLNSTLNPIIFCWRMREIRGYVLQIGKRILPCLNLVQVSQISDKNLSMLNTSHYRREKSIVNVA